MRQWVHGAATAAVVGAMLFSAFQYEAQPSAPSKASFAVKIEAGPAHGSGTHIGGGRILTAAHVVADAKDLKVKTDDGREVAAELLWANTAYDIALVSVADGDALSSVDLTCSTPHPGTKFTAFGNPGMTEFVYSRGEVVGLVGPRGPWREVMVINGTIVPGMSGGALVSGNKVVGVVVGVQSATLAMFPSVTGFGTAVPASTVCKLLARS